MRTQMPRQVARVHGQVHGCDWQGCAPFICGFYWTTDDELMDEICRTIAEAVMTELR